MAEHGDHFLVPGFVAQAGRTQVAGLQGQAGYLGRGQADALVGWWQQARVVVLQDGQIGLQLADFQLGLRIAHFQRGADPAVLIGSAAIVLHRQQTGAGAIRAAVELEAEQANGIDAHPQGARGITGLEVEDKALAPFLSL
ncbi:hypothetical protein D3C78_1035850 [compost metagenome]